MGKLELAITNLAEVTANEMHNTNNSFGLEELKIHRVNWIKPAILR